MNEYSAYLDNLRMSGKTKRKYMHNAEVMLKFIDSHEVTHQILEEYKSFLLEKYTPVSAKSMIIAANKYLEYIGANCRISHKGIPSNTERPEILNLTNAEYEKLLNAAKTFRDERMYMIIKTLCGAGLQI